MQLAVDEQRCVGSGQCVVVAPRVFDQRDEDGIVMLRDSSPDRSEDRAVAEAVLLCPSAAIRVLDDQSALSPTTAIPSTRQE